MPRVVYAPEAENDLVEIADHIARDKPQAARRWTNTIRETCETLATQPEAGELRPGFEVPECRSFRVGNYDIFYRPAGDPIEVARIVHGSRDMKNLWWAFFRSWPIVLSKSQRGIDSIPN